MPVYIEQIIDFEELGPYQTVYKFNGGTFLIAGRK